MWEQGQEFIFPSGDSGDWRSIWEPLVPVSVRNCLTSYLCHNPQQWFPQRLFIEICLAYFTNELLTAYVHGLVYTLSYFPLCGTILLASPYFLISLSLGFWQYSLLVLLPPPLWLLPIRTPLFSSWLNGSTAQYSGSSHRFSFSKVLLGDFLRNPALGSLCQWLKTLYTWPHSPRPVALFSTQHSIDLMM